MWLGSWNRTRMFCPLFARSRRRVYRLPVKRFYSYRVLLNPVLSMKYSPSVPLKFFELWSLKRSYLFIRSAILFDERRQLGGHHHGWWGVWEPQQRQFFLWLVLPAAIFPLFSSFLWDGIQNDFDSKKSQPSLGSNPSSFLELETKALTSSTF